MTGAVPNPASGPVDIPAQDIEAYVRAALALHGYALDEARIRDVTAQFARIAVIAGAVLRAPVPPGAEPLPVFRP